MEEWKDIKGYEGKYQVSNLGRVKSLSRLATWGDRQYTKKEIILKGALSSGYYAVGLHKNNKGKKIRIHQLVWNAFGDGRVSSHNLVIDHIDENKLNNNIANLQLLSPRKNVIKGWQKKKKTSCLPGVCWHKGHKKWCSKIVVNLGYFETQEEANKAYEDVIKKLGLN